MRRASILFFSSAALAPGSVSFASGEVLTYKPFNDAAVGVLEGDATPDRHC